MPEVTKAKGGCAEDKKEQRTTFSSYGNVAEYRQAEIIRALEQTERPGMVIFLD